MIGTLALGAAALAGSALLTDLLRRWVLARGLLDLPNERSAHIRPTPRGGGAAIVIVTTLVLIILCVLHRADFRFALALGGGGLAVAAVGLWDDRRSVGAGTRLAVHFGAASWAIGWLGGVPPLRVGHQLVDLGLVGDGLGLLGIVWTLNFFNFMDGIDGIAASEAAFIAGAAVLLGATGSTAVSAVAVTFVAACCGFLAFNWPPARIFLGDVGSGFLGFAIAVMALSVTRQDPAALWVWLILTGTFFVDATVTLVRRMRRGERAHQPHRSHAYQWLARRWRGHASVTVGALALNVFWLLPCAWFASRNPPWAAATVIFALGPLVPVFLLLGSGRSETNPFRPS
jgi:Fuc2NAc and GlcNAc transferase